MCQSVTVRVNLRVYEYESASEKLLLRDRKYV